MVGVEEKDVETAEVVRVFQGLVGSSDVIKVNRIPSKCLGQHGIILVGIMVIAFVPEKEDPKRFALRHGHRKAYGQQELEKKT